MEKVPILIEENNDWLDQPFTFNQESIKNINLKDYPRLRTHFLIDALIKNRKLPSEKTMIRIDKRNKRKGARVYFVPSNNYRSFKKFRLPNKYGKKPPEKRNIRYERFNQNEYRVRRNMNQSPKKQITQQERKLGQNVEKIQKFVSKGFYFTELINPQFLVLNQPVVNTGILLNKKEQQNIKLPAEIIRKKKDRKKPKIQNDKFKVRSPEWNQMKGKKIQIQLKIQTLRKAQVIRQNSQQTHFDVNKIFQKKPIPQYFQKKKRHQQRRRLEKHILITNNRQALRKIFGDAIFKSGWPVSRKQIKQVLGIQLQQQVDFRGLSDFLNQSVD